MLSSSNLDSASCLPQQQYQTNLMSERPYKLVVRLPSAMRSQVAEAAAHYRRSMNSEIVARLEQSFGVLPRSSTEQEVEPPLHPHIEAIFRSTLNDKEQSLIKVFRRLDGTRQQALLDLLS